MDYEYRIKVAEAELAHLRELQALSRSRLDAHDSSIESLDVITRRTAANLDVLTVQVGRLETRVDMLAVQTEKLELKIDQLIDALLHGRLNGGVK